MRARTTGRGCAHQMEDAFRQLALNLAKADGGAAGEFCSSKGSCSSSRGEWRDMSVGDSWICSTGRSGGSGGSGDMQQGYISACCPCRRAATTLSVAGRANQRVNPTREQPSMRNHQLSDKSTSVSLLSDNSDRAIAHHVLLSDLRCLATIRLLA